MDSLLSNQNNKVAFKSKERKGYISVIIPVYKDYIGLVDTLKSLHKQTLSIDKYEIIVANDGADKEVSKVCKKYNVKEVSIEKNKGSYNARNKSLEVSKGEYIAFTDADVVVPATWLVHGLKYLEKYDYVGGSVNIDSKKVFSVANHYEFFNNPFPVNSFMKDLHFSPTANVFTKRKVINLIGGFDDRLYSSGDVEFGNRVYSSKKFEMQYIDTLSVLHPPRKFKSILLKTARIARGEKDLYNLYPTRFSYLKRTLFHELKGLLPCLLTKDELKYNKKITLFFLKNFIQIYRCYCNIKNLRY